MAELTDEQKAARAVEDAAKKVEAEAAAAAKKAEAEAAKKAAAEAAAAKKAEADAVKKAAAEELAAKRSAAEGAAKIAADLAGEVAAMEKGKYEALRPVNHDHTTYPVGGIVMLSEAEAEPLLMHQFIKPATKEVAL